MGITAELCEKIVATGWDDLSEEAIMHLATGRAA